MNFEVVGHGPPLLAWDDVSFVDNEQDEALIKKVTIEIEAGDLAQVTVEKYTNDRSITTMRYSIVREQSMPMIKLAPMSLPETVHYPPGVDIYGDQAIVPSVRKTKKISKQTFE